MEPLLQLRKEIDALDQEIITLLGKRFECVRQVAEFKKEANMPPLQSNRWQEVLSQAKDCGMKNNLSPVFIGVVWNAIHEFALETEEQITKK